MNNDMKFDPNTGKPIANQDQTVNTQTLQSVPNVEQNNTQFIDNIEKANKVDDNKNKEKKSSTILIIFVFILLMAAILFLFPYISKNL